MKRFDIAYAEVLREDMEKFGITVTQLAQRTGVTTQTIRNGLDCRSQSLPALIIICDHVSKSHPHMVQVQIQQIADAIIKDNTEKWEG